MKVAVIGCGYVGLITGVGLASKGHQVIAIDIDPGRINQIKQGIVPFHEPGVDQALKHCLKRGNFNASHLIDDVAECNTVLVCVQTPPWANGTINLQILKKAVSALARVFNRNPMLRTMVIRSTVIPGTTDELITPIFRKVAPKTQLAFNPEFLREGSALSDFLNPDRIVIGTHSAQASKVLRQLFTSFNAPIVLTTPSIAELSKYASNLLLATLISFSNEIARMCERTPGADVEDVLKIIHQDRRFTSVDGKIPPGILTYLKAGCGFGGSCFPKDLSAFIAYARSTGEEPHLLKAVAVINASQTIRVVNMTADALGGLNKRKITVLGVAFKGGTDDLRESPGLKIVDELLRKQANVTIYDPLVPQFNLKNYQDKGVILASTIGAALKGADACIIASNAPEFKKMNNWQKISKHKMVIVDGRRILRVPEDYQGKFFAVGLSKE